MSKEANINKQKQSILNGFFEADAGLAYPKKGRRDLEIQWIEQYNIEDVDKDIALKALELLGNALYEDPYSDESGDILDILNCKLRILSDYSERYKDSPIWQKMERASIEDLEGDLYVDFSIEHFDEWGDIAPDYDVSLEKVFRLKNMAKFAKNCQNKIRLLLK